MLFNIHQINKVSTKKPSQELFERLSFEVRSDVSEGISRINNNTARILNFLLLFVLRQVAGYKEDQLRTWICRADIKIQLINNKRMHYVIENKLK